MKYSKYSAIIVGSGIAGLYLALKLEAQKKLTDGILIITKSRLNESNSRLAQGGIVAVMQENKMDSVNLHVADTIRSGCGLTDFNVAKFISENSSHVIKDLLKMGVEFDKKEDNNLSFTLEGAHTIPRILHAGGDATGDAIERKLCEKIKKSENITVYEQTSTVELLTDANNECKGVLIYNNDLDEYEAVYSNAVVLATGGVGQVFKHTTNPKVATGDGMAIAKKAGAILGDMEFIQFHPTALATHGKENQSLISEAVRGEGAKLVSQNGESFMQKYDLRAELAPRDIVARAIFKEIEENNQDFVYLDVASIGYEKFKKRFPSITKICEENSIDLERGLIPVSPAAHYCMGGIKTNISGETNITNLYAIGEVANTGLHGANRLASNSLLECVVCAWELSNTLSERSLEPPKKIDEQVKNTVELYSQEIIFDEIDIEDLIAKIKDTMWRNVGIIRDEKHLIEANMDILSIEKQFPYKNKCQNVREYELRNLIEIAKTIINSALNRKESRGAHFRSDYNYEEDIKIEVNKASSNDKIFIK